MAVTQCRQHSLCAGCWSASCCSKSFPYTTFCVLPPVLRGRFSYFMDVETEEQREEVRCPKSHSWEVQELGF